MSNGKGHHLRGGIQGAITPDITLLGLAPQSVSAATQRPAIAGLADGGYVLAWTSPYGNDANLHLQRYDANGEAAGPGTQIGTFYDGLQQAVVIGERYGSFAVAYRWFDDVYPPYVSRHGISLLNFGFDGTQRDGEEVDSATNSYPFRRITAVDDPRFAPLDDGGYMLAWHWTYSDPFGPPRPYGTYQALTLLQRYDGHGDRVGNPAVLQDSLPLTAMEHGGFLLGRGLYDGWGRFVALLDPEFASFYRAIDALGDGGYAIAFEAGGLIYTQRLDASGEPIGNRTLVSSDHAGAQLSLAGLSDGSYAVAWNAQPTQALPEFSVWLQRFDSSGQPQGEALRVQAPEPYDAGQDTSPVLAALRDGGFALTWSVRGDDGSFSFFTQRFEEARLGSEGADRLAGTAQADRLYGLAGADRIWGLEGDDKLDGGAGSDRLFGGPGNDRYVVDDRHDSVVERPGEGEDTVYSSVTWRLDKNVENLVLTGTSAIDGWGNAADNLLTGNAAANRLDGGPGNDTLNGGAGRDIAVFSTRPGAGNVDVLLNFVAADDTIELDASAFKALKGAWNAEAFTQGAAATSADDRIIHDPATGALLYDPDGSGPAAAVQFAVLVGLVGVLTADNFVVA